MAERRSVRVYADAPIPLSALSELLWALQGRTGEGVRASPSAGGLYPLRVHVLVRRVTGLARGMYAYEPDEHVLERLTDSTSEPELGDVGIGEQPWLDESAAVIAIGADIGTATDHFESQPPRGERGARYAFIEAGAAAENAHLAATALDLGLVLVAGFDDTRARAAFRFPPEFLPAVLLCVGDRADPAR